MDAPTVPYRQTYFRNTLSISAGVVGILACSVLIGWIIRSVALTQIMPSFAPMQFNTALMFLTSSVSTLLAFQGKHRFALIGCVLVVSFSSVTALQYPLGVSFGIDTLFVEPFTTARTSHPGRMAPNTAIAFVLTGFAIAGFSYRPRWTTLPVAAATLAFSLGLLALYGYLAAAENAYGWGDFTRMALHTATGFIILSSTLLAEGWRRTRDIPPPRPLPHWLSYVALTLAVTVALCAWNSIVILQQKRQDREMRTLAFVVNQKVSLALNGNFHAMVRMGDRFEGGMRGEGWIDDSVNYLTDIRGLFAIAYFKESTTKPVIIALDQSREHEVAGYSNIEALKSIAERASIFHDHEWREDAFLISIRIRDPQSQKVDGYLVGFFDTIPFFEHSIKNKDHRNRLQISIAGIPLFTGSKFASSEKASGDFATEDDPDHPWSVTATGSQDLSITEVGVRLSTIVLFGGLLLSGLIAWIAKLGIDTYNLQLHQTDEEIREAYEELETLLFVVSHDLKEPVRSINSFTALLEDDLGETLNDDDRELLHRIIGGAERLDSLLSDVGTISRAYRMDKSSPSGPLNEIVQEQIEALNEQLQDTGSKLTVSHDLPAIEVEKAWTGRALNNLLSNAVKFAQPGMPAEITIEPYNGPEGKGIVVKDRGIGLPEKADDRLFDLFRRGVGKNVEGTGVGLAIVKKVAQHHGGKAWFKNRSGGGAEFYVTLSPAKKR